MIFFDFDSKGRPVFTSTSTTTEEAVEDLKSMISRLQSKARLQEDLLNAQYKVTDLLKKKLATAEQSLSEAKSQAANLGITNADLRSDLSQLRSENESLKEDIAELKDRLAGLERNCDNCLGCDGCEKPGNITTAELKLEQIRKLMEEWKS